MHMTYRFYFINFLFVLISTLKEGDPNKKCLFSPFCFMKISFLPFDSVSVWEKEKRIANVV